MNARGRSDRPRLPPLVPPTELDMTSGQRASDSSQIESDPKKQDALKSAVALFVASYNLCWRHSSLRMSPAMHAGLTRKIWTVRDLLTA